MTHQEIDARSLEYHRLAVERIEGDPELLGKAFALLDHWDKVAPHESRQEWREILSKPWEEARRIILEDSDEGQRVRQSSPLPCLLTKEEREGIAEVFWDMAECRRQAG